MAAPRPSPFIWASWLPRLMVGDVTCEWSLWHMTNYQYAKVPADDMSEWQMKHTELLRRLRDEWERTGHQVAIEDQNRFKLCIRASGLELVGVPDLVATGQNRITIVDAKTGQHRDRDVAQVKLYMACLPKFSPAYRDLPIHGQVAYADGHRVDIAPHDARGDFLKSLNEWLGRMQAAEPPLKLPSLDNCRFCKISSFDCPERATADVIAVDLDEF